MVAGIRVDRRRAMCPASLRGRWGYPAALLMALHPSPVRRREPRPGSQLYAQSALSCTVPEVTWSAGHELSTLKKRRDPLATVAFIKHPKATMPLYPRLIGEQNVTDLATHACGRSGAPLMSRRHTPSTGFGQSGRLLLAGINLTSQLPFAYLYGQIKLAVGRTATRRKNSKQIRKKPPDPWRFFSPGPRTHQEPTKGICVPDELYVVGHHGAPLSEDLILSTPSSPKRSQHTSPRQRRVPASDFFTARTTGGVVIGPCFDSDSASAMDMRRLADQRASGSKTPSRASCAHSRSRAPPYVGKV